CRGRRGRIGAGFAYGAARSLLDAEFLVGHRAVAQPAAAAGLDAAGGGAARPRLGQQQPHLHRLVGGQRHPAGLVAEAPEEAASPPQPQMEAPRPLPRTAPPVSWAYTSRRIGALLPGWVPSMNAGAPSGVARGSTAIERPALSGTPSAPIGPSGPSPMRRKNT